jgi:hypothetical protein
MAIVLRRRDSASAITPWSETHALEQPALAGVRTGAKSAIASLSESGSEAPAGSVIAPFAGFARPDLRGARIEIPATFGLASNTPPRCGASSAELANASICFWFFSLKTLAMLGAAEQIRLRPSTFRPPHRWPVLIR